MTNRLWVVTAFTLFALVPAAFSQTAPPQSAAKADYSQEAFVIEQMSTQVSFDNDGNRTREQTTRVRVKTDAGVQQWGLLAISFQSAVETADMSYVRVLKSDGTSVTTPPDNIQDLDAQITRDAPFYSDLREKHVAVKGLAKGDVLEYQVRWHPIKPLIPGQFWFEYDFQRQGIVLDERVEIKVPAERAVKFRGPTSTQSVKTDGGIRVFTWTNSRLQSEKDLDSDKKKTDAALGRAPAPDIQLSSFQSWAEVGQWYWALQKDRIEPSAAIRAKAAQLTKGMTDDAAKIQALYSFVSLQYRYIGIAFGIGRYQPHAADDVLSNNYGDCKDKHTLLAALLSASGITLYPALIGSGHKLDSDVPSPGQFDHIIGYLPQGKTALWLDTTPEVAPMGYLLSPLRGKPALVMLGDKSAQLISTPAEPALANTQTFNIEGKLSEDGSFQAHIDDTTRGDGELLIRSAFRRVPQPQWKDLVQQISFALGFAGTVSDIDASAPDATSEPFHFSYSYNRKEYPDWANRQFTVPGLPFSMPPAREDAKDPLWLGPVFDTTSASKIELPKGYKPQLPSNVDLKYDFAEYHATYSQDQGVLIAKRRLLIKLHEVPVSELDDYRTFVKNLQNDVFRYVQTSSSSSAPTSATSTPGPTVPLTLPAVLNGLWSLPDSPSQEANRLEADARASMTKNDAASATGALKHALETAPKFTRAWVELATVYLSQRQNEAALDALRKAIESDPKALVPRKVYAYSLSFLRRDDAAVQAWRDVLAVAPDDADANPALGAFLLEQKHYAEALPYLEAAAKAKPSTPAQIQLGTAYLRAGQTERGSEIFEKVLESDSKPETFNDIAYELADANISLPKALEYAERAVDQQEKESLDLSLSELLPEDLACTQRIGSFWDTLGWVQFRLGHYDQAEAYLQPAWLLSQMAVIADHLGQVYEQEKKTEKAIHMYRLANAVPESGGISKEDIRRRLDHLGVKAPANPIDIIRSGDRTGDELSQLRSVKLKRLVPGSATAEFFLLFSPGPRLEDVAFISGDEKLKSASDALETAKFQVAFPASSSARLVRRAIVMCSPVSGCEAVLYTPNTVHSVN
jgi:Tfp pilus assembly protein PilF